MQTIKKPNNIINIKSVQEGDNYKLVNVEGYFEERFNFEDFYDGQKLTKFIKSCEKQIRKSNEYSKYIGDLRNNKGLNHCAYLGNISGDDAEVEFHHYPFTLYDIVFLTVNKYILEGKKFNTFTICRAVLNEHSRNRVALVPLCVTAHQLVHAGRIFINLNMVYGKINEFVNEFYRVLTDEMIEKYNKLVDMTEAGITYSDEDILKTLEELKTNPLPPIENEEDDEELLDEPIPIEDVHIEEIDV